MRNAMTLTTIVTLGNAAEVVAKVAEKVLGQEVANTFGGSPLSKELVNQLSMSVFQKKVATVLGE